MSGAKGCIWPGCTNKHRARGYCGTHYKHYKGPVEKPQPRETCEVEGCQRNHIARGYCHKHYKRFRQGLPLVTDNPPKLTPDHLEDIEWMAETGEHLEGAAQRLDVTQEAIEKYLERRDRRDLLRVLRARNPRDPNARTNVARTAA